MSCMYSESANLYEKINRSDACPPVLFAYIAELVMAHASELCVDVIRKRMWWIGSAVGSDDDEIYSFSV